MGLLATKLLITPLILWAATSASRRWGDAVGGWLVGLPVISGPVSVYLYLDRGSDFAALAAAGSISGVISQAAFCIGYALGAGRGLIAALALATLGYVGFGALALALAPSLSILMGAAPCQRNGKPRRARRRRAGICRPAWSSSPRWCWR